jgi:hypothetical protein
MSADRFHTGIGSEDRGRLSVAHAEVRRRLPPGRLVRLGVHRLQAREKLLPEWSEYLRSDYRWLGTLLRYATRRELIAKFGAPAQARGKPHRHSEEVEHRRTASLPAAGLTQSACW